MELRGQTGPYKQLYTISAIFIDDRLQAGASSAERASSAGSGDKGSKATAFYHLQPLK